MIFKRKLWTTFIRTNSKKFINCILCVYTYIVHNYCSHPIGNLHQMFTCSALVLIYTFSLLVTNIVFYWMYQYVLFYLNFQIVRHYWQICGSEWFTFRVPWNTKLSQVSRFSFHLVWSLYCIWSACNSETTICVMDETVVL